jgi:hypothetical protein
MGLVWSNFEFIRAVEVFPAPLCALCNQAMGLKAECEPTIDGEETAPPRHYQCRTCGAELRVRRSRRCD